MRSIGNTYEEQACTALQREGLTVLDRNYHTRYGELDLVMLDRDIVVFVEVRFRGSQHGGSAAESITASKRKKLILAARYWLAAHPRHARLSCRFDVVSYDGPAEVSWLRAAFDAE
ncbi:MAG TPA: YraN family protein [Dyella sp.]|uniref:YraN family protein n=1 Tax=Dyella sp. TaxID=1869338 RepID=UPI002F94E24F